MAGKCKWFSYKRMHPMAQNSRQKSAHLTGFYLLGGMGECPTTSRKCAHSPPPGNPPPPPVDSPRNVNPSN